MRVRETTQTCCERDTGPIGYCDTVKEIVRVTATHFGHPFPCESQCRVGPVTTIYLGCLSLKKGAKVAKWLTLHATQMWLVYFLRDSLWFIRQFFEKQ